MKVRLVVTITAAPGRGSELAGVQDALRGVHEGARLRAIRGFPKRAEPG